MTSNKCKSDKGSNVQVAAFISPHRDRIVINQYIRRMDDELDLNQGERISVITDDEEYNDGWFFGKNLATGKTGLFPSNFTQIIEDDEKVNSDIKQKSQRRPSSQFFENISPVNDYIMNDSNTTNNNNNNHNNIKIHDNNTINNIPQYEKPSRKETIIFDTMQDIDKALEDLQKSSRSFNNEFSLDVSHPFSTNNSLLNNKKSIQSKSKAAKENIYKQTDVPITEIASQDDLFERLHIKPRSSINEWTTSDVVNYFNATGFSKDICFQFQKYNITGPKLLSLELEDLKSLNISSFGTRFELYKEIEKLRGSRGDNITLENYIVHEKNPNNNDLLPAASFENLNNSSLETDYDTPTNNFRRISQQRRHSFIDDTEIRITSQKLAEFVISNNSTIFESPGVAPKPPSYPSPVQPQLSPANNKRHGVSDSIDDSYESLFEVKNKHSVVNTSKTNVSEFSNDSSSRFRFPDLAASSQSTINEPLVNSLDPKFPRFTKSKVVLKDQYLGNNTPSITAQTLDVPANVSYSKIVSSAQRNSISSIQQTSDYNHKKTSSSGSFVELYNRISTISESSRGLYEDLNSRKHHSKHSRSSVHESTYKESPGANLHLRKASQTNSELKKHRRKSSALSFLSPRKAAEDTVNNFSSTPRIASPSSTKQSIPNSYSRKSPSIQNPLRQTMNDSIADASGGVKTPNKKSYRHSIMVASPSLVSPVNKLSKARDNTSVGKSHKDRSTSYQSSPSPTRHANKTKIRLSNNKKLQTSAFVEGIRTINMKDAIQNADCSGWMNKRGSGTLGTWKKRFFTLHGTRLSYFSDSKDSKERGLIDINGHRVVPLKGSDKTIGLYATSIGRGDYYFKLVPPRPGSRKGLMFTQPRIHYFAVESSEEMRKWLGALIKVSIEIDTDIPTISSYAMPTVSLSRATEMLQEAREEMINRDKEEYFEDDDEGKMMWEEQQVSEQQTSKNFI